MKRIVLSGALFALAALVAAAGQPANAQDKRNIFNIGTAGVTGIFWPTGGYICNLVNRSRQSQGHNLRCTVESTAGSVYNLRAIRNGDLDLGLAQSDLQYYAYKGKGAFKEEGPNPDLRYIMSFTANMIHVVVREGSGIKTFRDIKGKRFNTGNAGSGTEVTARLLMSYFGLEPSDLAVESKLASREQSSALCDGKIDGYLYPTAVPVAVIEEAANTCKVDIISIDGPELDKLLEEHPYFEPMTIPANTYRGVDHDVKTFGYMATLVTSTKFPEEAAYNLAKAVMNGFEGFKQQGAAFKLMERESSIKVGRHIPYHPGAERYYREAGLLK